MVHRQFALTLAALAIVTTVSAATSEAGWFRRGTAYTYCYQPYYYYQTAPAVVTDTQVPTATQQAAPQPTTSGGVTYQTMKPVVTAGPAAAPTISYPSNSPGYSTGGYSVSPRSSWDYGRFPPYH
jgi:hypothetical protein